MESGYCPPGAEYDKRAPWNEKENPEREVEVTVSVTLSRTVRIKVSDYRMSSPVKDEDGHYYADIDYTDCNLEQAVREQVLLPQNLEALKDWTVDDYVAVLE